MRALTSRWRWYKVSLSSLTIPFTVRNWSSVRHPHAKHRGGSTFAEEMGIIPSARFASFIGDVQKANRGAWCYCCAWRGRHPDGCILGHKDTSILDGENLSELSLRSSGSLLFGKGAASLAALFRFAVAFISWRMAGMRGGGGAERKWPMRKSGT